MEWEQDTGGSGQPEPPAQPRSGDQADLAQELTGDLACARCGYSLRGLSVRVACPECGLPVVTTLLSVIDPRAGELQPIRLPRMVAGGVVLWTGAALGAALLTWVLRARDALVLLGGEVPRPAWAAIGGLVCLVLSALGALALIRPHARVPRAESLMAGAGVLLYAPAAWIYWRINLSLDPAHPLTTLDLESPHPGRLLLRMAAFALGALILIAMRPIARTLAVRSVVVRTGRVDRQSMQVLAVVLLVGAAGDALALVTGGMHGTMREVIVVIDAIVVAAASMLLTLGLIGLVRDSVRLVPAILSQPLKPSSVLGGDGGARSDDGAMPEPDHG